MAADKSSPTNAATVSDEDKGKTAKFKASAASSLTRAVGVMGMSSLDAKPVEWWNQLRLDCRGIASQAVGVLIQRAVS